MSAIVTSRKSTDSTSRAATRRLLSRWQHLNQLTRDIFRQMADVEAELSRHVNLHRYTETGNIRGSFADCFLDSNEIPEDHDEWLASAIDASGV
jgi:hypothetical protein